MNITKLEQSWFILQNKSWYKLWIDIGNKTSVESLDNIYIDEMIISHLHWDHLYLPNILKLKPKTIYISQECLDVIGADSLWDIHIHIIKSGDTIDINGGSIKAFDVDHGPNVSTPLRENFWFLINMDGEDIYFCGDMFHDDNINVSETNVDYLLLPVWWFYTFGPKEALEFANKFAGIGKIIPMHYDKNPEQRDMFAELVWDGFNIVL